MELGCFIVVLGVNLMVSLGSEYLGFVRRGGSNDFCNSSSYVTV